MKRILSVFCFVLVITLGCSAVTFAKPVTIAVAPFKVSSESGLEFMETGIIDLFSSRLSVATKVVVLDKVKTIEAFKNQGTITESIAVEKAKILGADFLIFGNLDETPKRIQLESFVVGTDPEAKMLTFTENSSKYESADIILLLVNRISKDIKINTLKLEVPEESKKKPVAETGHIHAHPDTLLKGLDLEED